MRALLVSSALATLATAQEEFAHNGGGHGGGHYYYNGAGVFLFWLFFIVIIGVLLFGCVGGVYSWGGHAHTIHIGRIVDRDAQGRVQRVREIRDTTATIVDDDPYYRRGYPYAAGVAAHHDAALYSGVDDGTPYTKGSEYGSLTQVTTDSSGRVVQLATEALPGGSLPVTGSSTRGQERPIGAAAAKRQPLRLEL